MEQLLRGAVASDLMVIQLRFRERKYNPPTFLQLLSEIRSEEEYEASRLKLKTSVNPVQTKQVSDVKLAEIQHLKAEVQELKSIVAAVAMRSTEVKDPSVTVAATISHSWKKPQNSEHSELIALKKQVICLQKKLDNKVTAYDASANPTAVSTREASTRAAASHTRPARHLEEQFCYR